MNRAEFDSEEQEFRREIDAALNARRAAGRACPKPEELMAARSGVLFEGVEDVRRHAAQCPVCQQLGLDLAEYEFPPASEAEDRRMRSKWQAAGAGASASWFRIWRPFSLIAATAVLVAGFFVLRDWQRPTSPPSTKAAPHAIFVLTKAAIRVPASAVLVYRGNSDAAKAYLADLAAALESYRKDDYTEAAGRLASLNRKYPEAAEPFFYLGVCQLFLGQNLAAVESLEAARTHADGVLRDDISWYLGLAFYRVGRSSDAFKEVETLCMRAGEFKDRACEAAAGLSRK